MKCEYCGIEFDKPDVIDGIDNLTGEFFTHYRCPVCGMQVDYEEEL